MSWFLLSLVPANHVPQVWISPEALPKMVKLISVASLFLPLVAMVAAQDHEGEAHAVVSCSATRASIKILTLLSSDCGVMR